jgi:hypothetical protein
MTEPWRLPVKKVTNKQAMQDAQNETIGQMQHLGEKCNPSQGQILWTGTPSRVELRVKQELTVLVVTELPMRRSSAVEAAVA